MIPSDKAVIKEINENNYKAALQRINELLGAEPGTPEGNELNALATLVDAYERKQFPI